MMTDLSLCWPADSFAPAAVLRRMRLRSLGQAGLAPEHEALHLAIFADVGGDPQIIDSHSGPQSAVLLCSPTGLRTRLPYGRTLLGRLVADLLQQTLSQDAATVVALLQGDASALPEDAGPGKLANR